MKEKLELQIRILEILSQNLVNMNAIINNNTVSENDVLQLESNCISLIDKYNKLNEGATGVPVSVEIISNKLNKLKTAFVNNNIELMIEMLETLMIYFNSVNMSIQYLMFYEQSEIDKERIIKKQFINKYKDSTDPDIQEIIEYVKDRDFLQVFNAPFFDKYNNMKIDILYDEDAKLYYTNKFGKKMYLYQMNDVDLNFYAGFITREQDEDSPHRYFDDVVKVNEGDIIVDAGVAEGNFSLEVIDKAKKIYLVECDSNWINTLKITFKDYMDKIVIVDKMLGNFVDDTHTTIDEICKGEKINFIKMDIEGAEMDALEGAKETLKNSDNCKLAVCSYHKHNAEQDIREFLEKYGYKTYTSKGYMWFKDDEDTLTYLELRRGLVKAYN